MILLFGTGPAALALGPRWLVSVGILAGGLVAVAVMLADPTFPRRRLWDLPAARPLFPIVIGRALLVALALTAFVAIARPEMLFRFPRMRPLAWTAVMFLYPVSAYAQEALYRTFFFHRYARLFTRPAGPVLASGALFGWAHVAVNNVAAVFLAAVAGVLFASTYARARSTFLVTVEHALYGDIVFSIGLGEIFYSVTRWVAMTPTK